MNLLLVVASWQYSYLVEVDPGVSNALSCFESCHVRITSWGAVNVYAHVTSREHREDKRTTRPDTYIHIYKHSPRRGTHITINVGLAQARPNNSYYLAEFELHQKFETHCKRKKDTNKKIKIFLTKSKGCRDKEICYWSTM